MLVAVIDDGVNVGYYPNIYELSYDLEVTDSLEIVIRVAETGTRSHGTNCATIIKKYAPMANILSIKVLDDTRRGSAKKLAGALSWCLEHRVRLINLSVGSVLLTDYEVVHPIIATLIKSGAIIVAALSNAQTFSVIADIFGIVRVKEDRNLKNNNYRIGNKHPLDADFYAASEHTLALSKNEEPHQMQGNSYAAPLITALAHEILSQHSNYNVNFVKQKLAENIGVRDHNFNKYILPNFADELLCFGFKKGELYDAVYKTEIVENLKYDFTEKRNVLFNPKELLNNQIEAFVTENIEFISGVIYAGKAPDWLRHLSNNIFFWDESVTENHSIPFSPPLEEIPIIHIKSSNMLDFAFANELFRCFSDKDYPALCVSDKTLSYLFNLLYFPTIDKTLIDGICNLYDLSILLVCSDNNFDLKADITIYLGADLISINIEEIEEKVFERKATALGLTEYIISVFEGSN